MKYIIRKSAVKPITGSIVDTTNIGDKTTNTYSANIIDALFSEIGNQGWSSVNANINTVYITGGDILYKKIGKMVILLVTDIIVKTKLDGYNLLLASGLPPAQTRNIFVLNGTNGQEQPSINNLRITIDENGNLGNWYDYKVANSSMPYYGQFVYFTK